MRLFLLSELYLQDRMGTGGVSISTVLAGDSDTRSKSNSIHEFLYTFDWFHCQPDDIHILLCVLSRLQLLPPIEKVKKLATVYFIKRYRYSKFWELTISESKDVFGS